MEQRPLPADLLRASPFVPQGQGEQSVEIAAIREGWRLILGCCLLGAAMAAGYVAARTPAFESKVQLLIENHAFELFRDEPLVVPALMGPNQLESQVRVIGSEGLALEVIRQLALASDPEFTSHGVLGLFSTVDGSAARREQAAVATFMQRLSVGSLGFSSVIEIGFSSADPEKAARIAAAVATRYLARLDAAADARGDGSSPWVHERLREVGIRASVISDATASAAPIGLRGALLVPAAALAGLGLGTALAILCRLLDWHARTPEEIASVIGAELFGTLPVAPTTAPAKLVAAAAETQTVAQMAAALAERRLDRGTIVGITAPARGEGVTTVATALAWQLGRHGHDVLLIDANSAGPSLTRRYDLTGERGLADVLGGAAYEQIRVGTDVDGGFDVLPVGAIGREGGALLQRPAFSDLAHRLRSSYDYVLVDMPAILGSAEVRAAADWIHALVLVVAAPPRRRATLRRALALTGRASERLIGVVVNRTGG